MPAYAPRRRPILTEVLEAIIMLDVAIDILAIPVALGIGVFLGHVFYGVIDEISRCFS